MKTLDVLVALFAGYMLFRHLPRALSLRRGREQARPMALVSLVNVVLAVALLALAARNILSRLAAR